MEGALLNLRFSRGSISTRVQVYAAGLLLALQTPAHAIPSPELIVGSISSVSQLVALLSALIGGGAVFAGARASSKSQGGGSARLAWRVAAVAFLLLTASLLANAFQYFSQKSALQARLEATLTKPTPTANGETLDPALKEISYPEQLRSSHGTSTEEVGRLLALQQQGEAKEVVFLDIRETAETEMGGLAGARQVRFPDLLNSGVNLSGKKAILFCHNGNRSSETCEKLAAMGVDCQFIVGGLEKWLVEKRPLAGSKVRTLADLRAVPSHRNQSVLLDTPDVHKLVDAEGAIFVDVRYPGEFSVSHLSGAINLPIRPTPTEELHRRIEALPRKPIIAPCYDRRSCFFGEVLGLELERRGHDYRGRYTLPWEYAVAGVPRPYIQDWLAEANQTYWDKLVAIVSGLVQAAEAWFGFLGAILILAILSRILVLPISLKAERDQILARSLNPEMLALKARLKDDPQRLARAIRSFYRRHGFTPVRNLLGLAFLPVMTVSVSAVQRAASFTADGLLWFSDPAGHDPLFILPLIFAGLVCWYLELAYVATRRQRVLTWLLGVPILAAMVALLSAAANVYVIVSAALLLLQRIIVSGALRRAAAAVVSRFRDPNTVPLARANQLAQCGNKAFRLGQLKQQGVPVPDGLVLTAAFLVQFTQGSSEWRARELDRIWKVVGSNAVAVRSSGGAEDGSVRSFAGIFESRLNVTRANFETSLEQVIESFSAERATGYGAGEASVNILVQRMVRADYAGVLFTRDPCAAGLSVVEAVAGTADRLVSGLVTPQRFVYGRFSGESVRAGPEHLPLDFAPLLRIGRKLESFFGASQDIEWVIHGGEFAVVQSRDITRTSRSDEEISQTEWDRILSMAKGATADEVVFRQNELSEMIPHPKPLSLSLLQSLWASGGSLDRACMQLGIHYPVDDDAPPFLVTLFGRLYVDHRQEKLLAPRLSSMTARRLRSAGTKIEERYRAEVLPEFLRSIVILEAVDFEFVPINDLCGLAGRIAANFTTNTHVEVDIINVAAEFYMSEARRTLEKVGLEPAKYLASQSGSIMTRILRDADALSQQERKSFLRRELGHRSLQDYELAYPRFNESSEIEALFSTPLPNVKPAPALPSTATNLARTVELARRFQDLKEEAKHHCLREFAVLRRALSALDHRLKLGGLIFYLTSRELGELSADCISNAVQIAVDRRARADSLGPTTPLEAQLTLRALEQATAGLSPSSKPEGLIAGTRVSGGSMTQGRACVVSDTDFDIVAQIPGFQDGDIVVSRSIGPSWVPYFSRASGFVCEVGGWLSHTAIMAREYDVPLIVGTRGLEKIGSGECLRLRMDGVIEIVKEPAMAKPAL